MCVDLLVSAEWAELRGTGRVGQPRASHQDLGYFRLGFNAVQMTLGTVAEFAGALITP